MRRTGKRAGIDPASAAGARSHGRRTARPHREPRRCRPPAGLLVLLVAAGCGGGSVEGGERGLLILPPETPQHPDLVERAYFHDFGHVPDGDVVQHVFRIENESDGPIDIQRVNPSCGCTVPALSYVTAEGARVEAESEDAEPLLTVPAGAVLELELRVDSRDVRTKNTDKLLSTQIVTSSEVTPFLQLETHLVVVSPFQQTPPSPDLGLVPENAGAALEVEIAALKEYPYRLTEVLEAPAWVETSLSEEDRFGTTVWTLSVRFLPPLKRGRYAAPIRLGAIDDRGEPYRPYEVSVLGTVVRDLQLEPGRLVLVSREGSGPAVAEVELFSLVPGHRFAVTDVELEPEHRDALVPGFAAVEPSSSGRAERWTLGIRAEAAALEAGAEGQALLQGTLLVRTDDPQTPEVEVPYVVHRR